MEKEKVRVISQDGKTVRYIVPHLAADQSFLNRHKLKIADPKVKPVIEKEEISQFNPSFEELTKDIVQHESQEMQDYKAEVLKETVEDSGVKILAKTASTPKKKPTSKK